MGPEVMLIGLVVAVLALAYPLIALGRIWLYSKEQVELLREIRDDLKSQARGGEVDTGVWTLEE